MCFKNAACKGNELEHQEYQCVILHHHYYEYHYSPHKLGFQKTMWVGDQKLMTDLQWPYNVIMRHNHWHSR